MSEDIIRPIIYEENKVKVINYPAASGGKFNPNEIKSGTSIRATAALTRYLFNPVRLEIESTKYE